MAIAEPNITLPDEHHDAIVTLPKISDAHERHAKAAIAIHDLVERFEEAGKDPARAYERAHLLAEHFANGFPSPESEQIEELYEKLWAETAILTGRQKRNPDGTLSDYKTHPEFADDAEGE
jgi:hypothetical protein